MKKIADIFSKKLKLALSLLFTVHCSLSTVQAQQTFLDTLKVEGPLCGEIKRKFPSNGQSPYFSFLWPYSQFLRVGDDFGFNCDDTATRGYLTFKTDSLLVFKNQGYEIFIDSAKVVLYSGGSIGNNISGAYPDFSTPDTVWVSADHVNIGTTLDTTDWTAGDVGDLQTITPEIDIITKDPWGGVFEDFNVTKSLQNDIDIDSVYSQYRISFPGIESDFDCLTDYINFLGSGATPSTHVPRIIATYTLFHYGDTDFDNLVTELDAQEVLEQIVNNPTELQIKVGDVDGNGKLQVYDASLILQFANGLITQFPVD